MQYRIIHSKFLEGLKSIEVALSKDDGHRFALESAILVDVSNKDAARASAVFREGLIKARKRGARPICPNCGALMDEAHDYNYYDDTYDCPHCHAKTPGDVLSAEAYVLDPHGMAEFIRRKLGLQYVQDSGGGAFKLGKFHDKKVYFCGVAQSSFFNSHNEDTILISFNLHEVPKGWSSGSCRAIGFLELFYEKKSGTEICISDAIEDLKPKTPTLRLAKNRVVHERRSQWLSVMGSLFVRKDRLWHFSAGGEPIKTRLAKLYLSIFKDGCSVKTCTRDLDEFLETDPKGYDKREVVMGRLLKLASDKTLTDEQCKAHAMTIKTIIDQAKRYDKIGNTAMLDMPKTGWAVGADGKSERVNVTTADAIYDGVAASYDEATRTHAA